MQRRCCCPPESADRARGRRSFTSSQSAARLSARSTISSVFAPRRHARASAREGRRRRCRGSTSSGTASGAGRPCRRAGAPRSRSPRARRCRARRADLALHPRRRHRLVHAVEAAQECRLAAPGRADDRRHRAILESIHRDALSPRATLPKYASSAASRRDAWRRGLRPRLRDACIVATRPSSQDARAQSPVPPVAKRARVAKRAMRLMTRTSAMRTSAPAQASACHSS